MRTLKLAVATLALTLSFGPAALAAAPAVDSHAGHGVQAKKATADKAKAAEGDYVCPMGPACGGYQQKPGECPSCGMKLIHKSELKK